jgi:GT2 family glycosyltransferase
MSDLTPDPAPPPVPEAAPRPDVSIAILSFNTAGYLRRCLASIFDPHDSDVLAAWERAGRPLTGFPQERTTAEVIVVDQDSCDDSVAVARSFPQVQVLALKQNLGFSGGNNLAWEHSLGRYQLLLNSDTVVRPGWISELVEYADAHPRAGLIGPKLVNPDGTLQYSCRSFPSLGMGVFRHTPFEVLMPKNAYTRDYLMRDWDHAEPRNVDWLSGACILARREMIEQIGGLDDGYFMYFEDVDWGARAHEAGWEVHYVPSPVILHEVGRSSDRRPKRMIVMHHESAYRYFCRHSHLGKSLPGRAFLIGALCARAALMLARKELIACRDRLRGPRRRA